MQGTVIHRSRSRALAIVLAFSAVLVLLGPIAPLLFILVLILVIASLAVDIDGGEGWARRLLVLKDTGYNVLLFRGPRLPEPADTARFQQHPPGPPFPPLSQAPQLLICAPSDDADIHQSILYRVSLAAGLLGITAGSLTLAVPSWRAAGAHSYAVVWLLLVSAVALLSHALQPATRTPSPALPHVEALIDALRDAPPTTLTVSFAFIEGMYAYGDGVVTLLKNYAIIVPPAHTRVLLLSPEAGALTVLPQAGLLGRLKADPALLEAAAVDSHPGRSAAAAQAQRIGWRVATLQGDLSETEHLMEMVTRLDALAAGEQW
jgi:hypothetical protein